MEETVLQRQVQQIRYQPVLEKLHSLKKVLKVEVE